MNHSIELFIHDSFLDSFSALPKPIQKRARELLKKFKENPKSSALNYEKISTFKDQSLRTLRINEKYRAIIQAPEKGNGYHLLWVDNHDEAMDWAKNKIFSWNQETQAFQLFEQPEQNAIQEKPQAKEKLLFDFLSDSDLKAIGTPEQMTVLVRSLTTLDDLHSAKPNLPADVFEYLFYLAEGISITEILEDISAGKEDKNPMQSSNALKHAFIITDDEQLEEILNGNFEKWRLFLHPSQRALAYRDFNGPVKVTGGAGTGKTVCAIHRIKYLTDKTQVYDQPILFTTYTKSLTQYLQETVKAFGIPENQIEISNIDKLIFDLANSPKHKIFQKPVGYFAQEQEKAIWSKSLEKVPSQFDVDFLYSEFNEVILPQNINSLESYLTASRVGRNTRIGRKDKIEIWSIIEEFNKQKEGNYSKLELCNLLATYFKRQKVKPYSHLICDEIQDFSNPELSLMRSLVEEKENDLFLVGDPYQNIYRRSVNFGKSGISVRGKRSRKLKINYRTTEEIKRLAMKVVSNIQVDDFDGNQENLAGYLSLMHGNQPSYDIFNTPEQEDKFILEKLKTFLSEGNIHPNEICIATRTNAGLDEVKKLLNTANIKYLDLSNSKENDTAIRVSTFHNMKGHEFKIVFVKGVSEDKVPLRHLNYVNLVEKEKADYEQQERSLYYVVFSRAIQSVYITGVGEKSSWF
jgi:hypothetical protein